MNNYGQPDHPETAMLGELHTLWGRVFGEAAQRGARLVVGAAVMVLVAIVWVVL